MVGATTTSPWAVSRASVTVISASWAPASTMEPARGALSSATAFSEPFSMSDVLPLALPVGVEILRSVTAPGTATMAPEMPWDSRLFWTCCWRSFLDGC
jgi:hypothetical protein